MLTPLHLATTFRQYSLMTTLLMAKADIHSQNGSYTVILYCVIYSLMK
jgi:hypothetical protein